MKEKKETGRRRRRRRRRRRKRRRHFIWHKIEITVVFRTNHTVHK
jgi:hypothetical protein